MFIRTAAVLAALSGLSLSCLARQPAAAAGKPEPARSTAPAADAPTIQLAILLDTSGSMSGLIDQAKTQIWSIVNDMTRARMEGKRPQLRVSLYEYGKSSIPPPRGTSARSSLSQMTSTPSPPSSSSSPPTAARNTAAR